MSRTKVMAQKPRCAQNSKNCRKSMSLPLTALIYGENCRENMLESCLKPREKIREVL